VSAAACTVVLLTFNSAAIIRQTVAQALKVSSRVFVVDSGSTDGTVEIVHEMRCEVTHRAFTNYSDQRNWAIEQIAASSTWQLHLDADEVLDDLAIAEIRAVLAGKSSADAYMLKRRDYFMGHMLRFSGVNPWHLRLFRSGVGQCENRLYDQHFVSARPAAQLKGLMHDKNALSLSDWVARHNRWSDLEAQEAMRLSHECAGVLQARLLGDARERTRFFKGLYYRLPIALRAFSYFFFRYFVRLGFLDGVPGFYFAFFQAFWFRMLIDAKIHERRQA
jgi:glycosyltransferase involved in cell wall biosynthesis